MTLAKRILEGYETQGAVPIVGQMAVELPQKNGGKGLLAPVLESTLCVTGHMGEPQNKKLLPEFAFQNYTLHTKEYNESLDSHILELVEESGPMQPIGFQALEFGYTNDELPEGRYAAMLHRTTK